MQVTEGSYHTTSVVSSSSPQFPRRLLCAVLGIPGSGFQCLLWRKQMLKIQFLAAEIDPGVSSRLIIRIERRSTKKMQLPGTAENK